MQTADFNHTDFAHGREAEADSQLLVKFFLKEREDKEASQQEGRPIFKEREYVEIRVPGKRDALACRPATEADKQRFPRHYQMFKDRVEPPQDGTPLAEWPQISRSMAEELSFLRVKTVEQLVNMSDNDAGRIRGGMGLKEKAKAFLKHSDQTKLISEKQELEARLAAQDEEMAKMRAMLENMSPKPTAARAPEPDETANAVPPEIETEDSGEVPRVRKSRRRKTEE